MLQAKEFNFSAGKIPQGIHTNCKVSSVEVGTNYIDFNYEDSEKRTHNKRIWFPDVNKNVWTLKDKNGTPKETPQEALKRTTNEQLAHIVKHLHIFLSPQEIDMFSAPDFASFANKAATELAGRLDQKRVNLKLIYDKDGVYSEFGRYPDYIEEYVEGTTPSLYFTKYELENRCTRKVQTTSDTQMESTTADEDLY